MSATDDVKNAYTVYHLEAGRLKRFLDNVSGFVNDNCCPTDTLHRHCRDILAAKGAEALGDDGLTRLSLCLVANGMQPGQMCRERCLALIARACFVHIYALFNAFLLDAVRPYWPSTKAEEFDTARVDGKVDLLESHFGLAFNADHVDRAFLTKLSTTWHALVHHAGRIDAPDSPHETQTALKPGDEICPTLSLCRDALDELTKASGEIGYRLEDFLDPTTAPTIPLSPQEARE